MDHHASLELDSDVPVKSPGANQDLDASPDWEQADLAEDPRWQLAQRITASSSFSRSTLLSKFLLYVCNRELSGRTEEISEHQIGVHVFGRRPGYNPSEDNIVRNYARQLRQRLDNYFEEEGSQEKLRLSIPRGKYVPCFAPIPVDMATAGSKAITAVPPSPYVAAVDAVPAISVVPPARRSVLRLGGWIALMLIVIGTPLAWLLFPSRTSAKADPSYPLWTLLFDKTHQTLLVPADDGIVMIQNLTNHSVNLSEYVDRDYVAVKSPYRIDEQNMTDLDQQRYTSMADLDIVLKFSRLPETAPERFTVRYARELHMEDLKDSNAILIGSSFSNPWVELFQRNLNFDFTYNPHPNESSILNRHPLQGELPVYANDATAPSHRTYAVIALARNLNDTGWILIIEGLTMAGTQAAADVLFNREAMRPVLDKARAGNGDLNPFELLIETRSFGSNSPQASIVSTRIYTKPAS